VETQELIEHLSVPSAYPEQLEKVEVRQTHISVVFLVGALAYKIKKPVNLGFVDYTTLERRRHFCEEEVRLNRRLAPSVYLGVVPVTQDGGRISMEGEGTVVEWAVKMERLPDRATLLAHLEHGEVGADSIEELARRLAEFHARATSGGMVARGGSFEAVARNALENFEQSAGRVGSTLSSSTFERLKSLTEKALADLRDIIADRAVRGVPRDTHGDLRLEHVYWFPQRRPPDDWLVVDCIEFNDRYRHADPIAELAFLAMELMLEGRGNLADTFVEAYLRASGDQQGRLLLPFYRSYRAAVRAKVEGMKLAEPEVPEPEKASARLRARARWLFALSELEEPGAKPCLVLLGGLPGTGKSTLARGLADLAGFSVIRSDVVRKELVAKTRQNAARASVNDDLYSEEWNDRTYQECLRRAEPILFEGGRALVDASFHKESRRQLFLREGRRWGIATCLIVCQANPQVVRERLAHRSGDASDANWTVHAQMQTRWDELSAQTRVATSLVDTGGSLKESLGQSIEALRRFGLVGEKNRAGCIRQV
jgi:aminoglycoside phosphotransferase family enzyme/predicted kinase